VGYLITELIIKTVSPEGMPLPKAFLWNGKRFFITKKLAGQLEYFKYFLLQKYASNLKDVGHFVVKNVKQM